MSTLPRHCLIRFADYKQKDLVVNTICTSSVHPVLFGLIIEETLEYPAHVEQPFQRFRETLSPAMSGYGSNGEVRAAPQCTGAEHDL